MPPSQPQATSRQGQPPSPPSPALPRKKRKTDARPVVILGLQGASPEPPDQPAITEKFLRVLFRVGFPKQPAKAANFFAVALRGGGAETAGRAGGSSAVGRVT